jgi:hypothetical protein
MKKSEIFEKEGNYVEELREYCDSQSANVPELRTKLLETVDHYEELINQAQLITKVSDRLQHKLNNLNDKLNVKNIELQETIDELTKARASRKATTIVLVVAIALFFFSEALLEPYIESHTSNFYLGFAAKFGLMLLLKPIDFVIEKWLLQDALKKAGKTS